MKLTFLSTLSTLGCNSSMSEDSSSGAASDCLTTSLCTWSFNSSYWHCSSASHPIIRKIEGVCSYWTKFVLFSTFWAHSETTFPRFPCSWVWPHDQVPANGTCAIARAGPLKSPLWNGDNSLGNHMMKMPELLSASVERNTLLTHSLTYMHIWSWSCFSVFPLWDHLQLIILFSPTWAAFPLFLDH